MKGWQKTIKMRFRYFLKERASNLKIVGIALSLAVVVSFICFFTLFGRDVDQSLLKKSFNLRGLIPAPEEIVIAAIDDETVSKLQADLRLWPRKFTAEALRRIVSAGPRVVILDLNFPVESYDPEADLVLETALRAGPTSIWSGEIAKTKGSTLGTDAFKSITFPSDDRFRKAAKMELPMWTLETLGERAQISSNLQINAKLYDRVPLAEPLELLGGYTIHTPNPQDLINFYGPRDHIKKAPLYEILNSDQDKLDATFKNKVVLVGYQTSILNRGLGNMEEFNVSVSKEKMFGVEIHANIVGNLIHGSWIKRQNAVDELVQSFMLVLGLSVLGLFLTFKQSVLMAVGVSLANAYVCFELFRSCNFWLPFIGPITLGLFLMIVVNLTLRYLNSERKNKLTGSLYDFELNN